MNIKVTLTDLEVQAVRDYLALKAECGPKKGNKGGMHGLMGKLARAIDKPVAAAPRKSSGKALWQVIGRPDLKDALEPTRVVVIGGEEIRSNWRFKSAENTEDCAVCGRGLRGARLAIVDMPAGLGMAHKACVNVHLGMFARPSTNGIRYSTSYQRFAVTAQPKLEAQVIKNPQVRPFGDFGLIAHQEETTVAA